MRLGVSLVHTVIVWLLCSISFWPGMVVYFEGKSRIKYSSCSAGCIPGHSDYKSFHSPLYLVSAADHATDYKYLFGSQFVHNGTKVVRVMCSAITQEAEEMILYTQVNLVLTDTVHIRESDRLTCMSICDTGSFWRSSSSLLSKISSLSKAIPLGPMRSER